MCLSKAYVDRNGQRDLIVEEVAAVDIEDGRLLFKTLFGEQKEVEAIIKRIDFMTHSIFLESLKQEGVWQKDKRLS